MASAKATSKPSPEPHAPSNGCNLFAPDDAKRFLDILDRAITGPMPEPPKADKPVEIVVDSDKEEAKMKTSDLKYKTVNEIWDNVAYRYKIAESSESTSEEEDQSVDYFFIVRRRFDKGNTNYEYFVDIKSAGLRDILREVLKEVKGVSLREDKPTVNPKLLFNYLPQFEKYLTFRNNLVRPVSPESEDSSHHIQHLETLVEFLRSHYASTIESCQALLQHGEIRFDLLWTLFTPNTIVYTDDYGYDLPRCLKLNWSEVQTIGGERLFTLDCCYLGYDGESLGEASITLAIAEFRGEMKINSLGAFPLIYHEKREEVKKNLLEMGRKFISRRGVHHLYHDGFAFIRRERKVNKIHIKGRIMVDAGSFKQNNPNYDTPKIKVDLSYSTIGHPPTKNSSHIIKKITPDELKEEDLLTCSPTVFGFSFSDKGWAEFAISRLEEIRWDSNPFKSLVLPKDRKEIIQALIESHIGHSFDDIVEGKGQGLIFLFHGPPGVGKTLTAEGISDFLKRPLYVVRAGDLGTSSAGLEAELSRIFDLASHWNAMVLLDEADIFLEKRSPHSLERNGLVSVFLRKLEYYRGIMFLTTNRVGTFDDAFQSRIHMPLKFNELDVSAKKAVWTMFLEKSCNTSGTGVMDAVSQGQLDSLARKELNGREIKNTVHTAHALAVSGKVTLSYEHLQTALSVVEEFKQELADLSNTAAKYGIT